MAGIRLFFKVFPNTYIESMQNSFRKEGVELKRQLKHACEAQITSKYRPIHLNQCPILIDITFVSTKNYNYETYNVLANYILDVLRLRGIIQDTTISVVNEVRTRVMMTTNTKSEGAFIRFEKNPNPYRPHPYEIGGIDE